MKEFVRGAIVIAIVALTGCGGSGGKVEGEPDASGDGAIDDGGSTDRCDEPLTWYEDVDGDGLGDPASSLDDCTAPSGYVDNADDTEPDCATNDTATCGVCGGAEWYQDLDGDGLGDPSASTRACTPPDGYVDNADDTEPDCATNDTDECDVCGGSGPATWYDDTDGDGLGDAAVSLESCDQPVGYVANSNDTQPACATNDEDVCGVCGGNGSGCADCAGVLDGDARLDGCGICSGGTSGHVPESDRDACGVCFGPGPSTWYEDADGDGLGDPAVTTEACDKPEGFVANDDDPSPNCASNEVDACGVCSGPGPVTWYGDADGDGLGDPAVTQQACEQPVGYVANFGDAEPDCATNDTDACGVCAGPGPATWYGDADGDGLGDPAVSQQACEQPGGYVANASDAEPDCATNDTDACGVCAGSGPSIWYEDTDGDGLGDALSTQVACEQPLGYVSNPNDDEPDCATNDTDACGVCGGPGTTTWYDDADGDGLGDPAASLAACDQPAGYVANASDTEPECATNDTDACGVCAGPGTTTFYEDADGDGLGDPAVSVESCEQPVGYVQNADDPEPACATNDTDACGVCGGIGGTRYYADADGDGHGDPGVFVDDCLQPVGHVLLADDCDDTNAGVHPGALEVLADGVDQNCDMQEICLVDGDGDGYIAGISSSLSILAYDQITGHFTTPALGALGLTATVAATAEDFANAYAGGDWDLVLLIGTPNNLEEADYYPVLDAHVNGNGRPAMVIDWGGFDGPAEAFLGINSVNGCSQYGTSCGTMVESGAPYFALSNVYAVDSSLASSRRNVVTEGITTVYSDAASGNLELDAVVADGLVVASTFLLTIYDENGDGLIERAAHLANGIAYLLSHYAGRGLTDGWVVASADADCADPGEAYIAALKQNGDCDDTNPLRRPGLVDEPDMSFLDANCDGMDGDASTAYFVSPYGTLGAAGTKEDPFLTIDEAVTAASPSGARKNVYVAGDDGAVTSYAESISLPSGVSLFGHYVAADWSRSLGAVTEIASPTTVGLSVQSYSSEGKLQGMTVRSASALAGTGLSSIAVLAENVTATFVIEASTLIAGNGGSGAKGDNGVAGCTAGSNPTSQDGDDGQLPGSLAGGGDGYQTCYFPLEFAGHGGNGGWRRTSTDPDVSVAPEAGDPAPSGASGGAAGSNQSPAANTTCTASVLRGDAGSPGAPGAAGSQGGILANQAIGTRPTAVQWRALGGLDGGDGTHGKNGGGGGGGGMCRYRYSTGVTTIDYYGGGGAGGGGGGAGGLGTKGLAGGGAGGSFALFAIDASAVSVIDSTLQSGDGGRGGNGGDGGVGGAGGAGGAGGVGLEYGLAVGGNGGAGGDGGDGGDGGGGGGGGGGMSAAIYRDGSGGLSFGDTENVFVVGTPGNGGSGGCRGGRSGLPLPVCQGTLATAGEAGMACRVFSAGTGHCAAP